MHIHLYINIIFPILSPFASCYVLGTTTTNSYPHCTSSTYTLFGQPTPCSSDACTSTVSQDTALSCLFLTYVNSNNAFFASTIPFITAPTINFDPPMQFLLVP
ncbi:hypothetical protein AAZX31_10G100700 [Glycine max]